MTAVRPASARLWRDRRGVAAVELALVAPILAALLLVSFEVWQAAARTEDARAALKTASQYYMNGGADDAAARTLAISAWQNAPGDAAISVARACTCGTVAQSCTTLCSDGSQPQVLVTLSASGSRPDAIYGKTISALEVVRVR